MEKFSDGIYRNLELPISMAATLRSVSSGDLSYVVERYSRKCYLARVAFKDRRIGLNGTSLAESPWLALVKAKSELIERSASFEVDSKFSNNAVCGISASVFSNLAARRAELELFERDALVNFWSSGKYRADMTHDYNWKRVVEKSGLSFDVRVHLVPSHKYFVAVALLVSSRGGGEKRLHAVGCHADHSQRSAGLAAVKEATMLALNDPNYSTPCPNFEHLGNTQWVAAESTQDFDFCLRSVPVQVGLFKVHTILSSRLSGLKKGSTHISRDSYERLYGCTPRITEMNIPYFTTGIEAKSHG